MTLSQIEKFIHQLRILKRFADQEMSRLMAGPVYKDDVLQPIEDISTECDSWLEQYNDYSNTEDIAQTMKWANDCWHYLRAGNYNGYVEESMEWA
jgi:hypothetical protein